MCEHLVAVVAQAQSHLRLLYTLQRDVYSAHGLFGIQPKAVGLYLQSALRSHTLGCRSCLHVLGTLSHLVCNEHVHSGHHILYVYDVVGIVGVGRQEVETSRLP